MAPSPGAAWSEADLLREAYAANLSTLRPLVRRLRASPAAVAALCLVTPRTVRRWLHTGQPDPTALRLLAILAGYVPWEGWQDWEVDHGLLFPPGFRRGGISPGEFWAIPYYRQAHRAYRARTLALEAELATCQAALAASRQALPAPRARVGNTGTLSHG